MAEKFCNPVEWKILGGKGVLVGLEIEAAHPYCEGEYDDDVVGELIEDEINVPDLPLIAAIKDDCSVPGAEVVTHPATREYLEKNLNPLLEWMLREGFFASSECGLHIHVSRSSFHPDTESKLCILLNQHTQAWKDFLFRVYGRHGREYANPVRGRFSWLTQGEDFENFIRSCGRQKFSRVNIQHDETLEFRQGAGTLEYRRIMRRVECSVALTEFADKTTVQEFHDMGGPEREVEMFLAHIEENAKNFPTLHGFLQD